MNCTRGNFVQNCRNCGLWIENSNYYMSMLLVSKYLGYLLLWLWNFNILGVHRAVMFFQWFLWQCKCIKWFHRIARVFSYRNKCLGSGAIMFYKVKVQLQRLSLRYMHARILNSWKTCEILLFLLEGLEIVIIVL